jgi:hypothetical protein
MGLMRAIGFKLRRNFAMARNPVGRKRDANVPDALAPVKNLTAASAPVIAR